MAFALEWRTGIRPTIKFAEMILSRMDRSSKVATANIGRARHALPLHSGIISLCPLCCYPKTNTNMFVKEINHETHERHEK